MSQQATGVEVSNGESIPAPASLEPQIDDLHQALSALQLALEGRESISESILRRAEVALWSRGSAVSAFTENLPCLAFLKDPEGRYLYVNALWERVFGQTVDQWHLKRDEDLWPLEDVVRLRENDRLVVEQQRTLRTIESLTCGGQRSWWLVSKFPLHVPGTPGTLIGGLAVEITDRVRAEEALKNSERRYRELFDRAPVGLYHVSPSGRLLLANPALLNTLGLESSEQLTSFDFRSRFKSPRDATRFAALLCSAGEVKDFDCLWQRADGSLALVREQARAVYDSSGNLSYYEGSVEDLTERARAELLERDRNLILEMVIRRESLSAICLALAQMIERQFPKSRSIVTLLYDGKLYPMAAPSFPPELMVQLQHGIPATADSGPSGAAAAEGRPVIVADFERIQQWPKRRDLMLRLGLKACWALPIFSADDRVVGTLTVCFEKVCTPSARERHLLELSARLAAIALEHQQLYDELIRQARHDALTGLPNRSHLESQLKELLSQTDSAPSPAILWLDLDRFKEINDSLGHRIGDLLLQQVAKRLKASLRAENVLARMGADEFAILAPAFSSAEQVESLAAAVLESFHEPFRIEGYELYLSASLGWALYPEDAEDGAALLRNADAAMHHAKARGRNCSQRFTQSIRESALSRLETEADLRQALIKREFELFYQPQMDLQARLRGMESLIRWRHPKNGLLSPASFIPVAEDVGLIVPIGAWVLQEACRQCAAWHKAGFLNVKVSVNVSALQFYYSDFADVVKQALESSGLDPRHLEIELTESIIMRNFEEAARQMERVRALGVSIAIDDFGTGYSSLSYLQNLPVDALKIDRSFLSRIDSQPTAAVVRAIAMLAHSLGLSVIAEGVETPEQLKVLADMNIDFAQGYLLGKPMEAQKTLNVLLQTQRWS